MSVTEHPTTAANPVPFGTLVVLRIDPVASVAQLHDEQATQEALKLQPRKILAVYNSNVDLEYAEELDGFRLNAVFYLAGRGLPPAPFTAAAIPIFPAPPLADSSRPSLRTVPDCPLPDCYIYTLDKTPATVCRIYHNPVNGYRLSEDDADEYRIASMEDNRAFAPLILASMPASERARYFGGDAHTSSGAGSMDDSEDDAPSAQANGQMDELNAAMTLFPSLIQPDNVRKMTFNVEMWVRIDEGDEYATVAEYRAIQKELERIEREWAQRFVAQTLSKEPQTTAWLAGVQTDVAAEPPQELDTQSAGEYDDLVQPEDAVEHQLERQLASTDLPAPTNAHSDKMSEPSPPADTDHIDREPGLVPGDARLEAPGTDVAKPTREDCTPSLRPADPAPPTQKGDNDNVITRLLQRLSSRVRKLFIICRSAK
ncbi:hypothetical protein EXIGLDRAFT_730331 [Exidia glandulosa HHB12029]|uniref:Uncharacterized protein n=1 Tax=Exidia glandulosa HHB12029 TaxID=1314781 RepID=A0A165C7M2_EXIGL|nr:hypothetical protein EXIGLDRAFT_730331 [Exidia glandulosa HHB12029]